MLFTQKETGFGCSEVWILAANDLEIQWSVQANWLSIASIIHLVGSQVR